MDGACGSTAHRRAVLVRLCVPRNDHRERIVRGCHARLLNVLPNDVVDEGGLATVATRGAKNREQSSTVGKRRDQYQRAPREALAGASHCTLVFHHNNVIGCEPGAGA